jgi:hypothetical protein
MSVGLNKTMVPAFANPAEQAFFSIYILTIQEKFNQ